VKMSKTDDSLTFPKVDTSTHASVYPIYLEPQVSSGERITIAVVAVGEASFEVAKVANLAVLNCVYGDETEALVWAADLVYADLVERSRNGHSSALKDWTPPCAGVSIGEKRVGMGASLSQVATDGLQMYSSLYGRTISKNVMPVSAIIADEAVREPKSRLQSVLRERLNERQPGLLSNFNKSVKIADGNIEPRRFGYSGTHLTANFTVLVPKALSARVNAAKSKLWDLGLYRQVMVHSGSNGSGRMEVELLAKTASASDVEYTAKELSKLNSEVAKLEDEAYRRQIRLRAYPTTEEIVDRIINSEAA